MTATTNGLSAHSSLNVDDGDNDIERRPLRRLRRALSRDVFGDDSSEPPSANDVPDARLPAPNAAIVDIQRTLSNSSLDTPLSKKPAAPPVKGNPPASNASTKAKPKPKPHRNKSELKNKVTTTVSTVVVKKKTGGRTPCWDDVEQTTIDSQIVRYLKKTKATKSVDDRDHLEFVRVTLWEEFIAIFPDRDTESLKAVSGHIAPRPVS